MKCFPVAAQLHIHNAPEILFFFFLRSVSILGYDFYTEFTQHPVSLMFCSVSFLLLLNYYCLCVRFLYTDPSTNVVKRLIHCREGGKGSQEVRNLPKEFIAAMIPIFLLDGNIWQ